MYERFTDRGRKVMLLANEEAQRFNHEYIGTEHILLGLVKEGAEVAANVLKNLDINLRKVRQEVEKGVRHGPGGEQVVMGQLPHTPRTKKSLEYAIEEARGLNHNYVGTEHLREQEGTAAQVLMNLGLKIEEVREEVLNLLGHNTPMVAGTAPDVPREDVFHMPKSLSPNTYETYPVSDLTPPEPLTAEQLQMIRDHIRYLTEQAEVFVVAQDFTPAARCRDEADALTRLVARYEWARTRLVAWYEWAREQR
jgi:ATP-dependent Clp protease ATP-binding subunit ClpA